MDRQETAAGVPISSTLSGSVYDRIERAGFEILTVRELSGSFQRIATCPPGTINVFPHDPFRSTSLDLRFGTKVLHQSECYPTDRVQSSWLNQTVVEVLQNGGTPPAELALVLRQTNLFSHADSRAADLPEGLARTLVATSATYCRARIIVLDRPFLGMDGEQIERVAQLLLERVERSRQIVLVTRQRKCPGSWRRSASVRVEGRRSSLAEKVRKSEKDSLRVQLAEHFIVTCPQVLKRVPTPSAVKSETILNSTIVPLDPVSDVVAANGAAPREMRRGQPLTKVTTALRVSRTIAHSTWWRAMKRMLAGVNSERLAESSLPGQARVERAAQKYRIRVLELALGLAICAFIAYAISLRG